MTNSKFYIQSALNKITTFEQAIKRNEVAYQEWEDARGTKNETAKLDNLRALKRCEFNLKQAKQDLKRLKGIQAVNLV
jgi:hypothetical protein